MYKCIHVYTQIYCVCTSIYVYIPRYTVCVQVYTCICSHIICISKDVLGYTLYELVCTCKYLKSLTRGVIRITPQIDLPDLVQNASCLLKIPLPPFRLSCQAGSAARGPKMRQPFPAVREALPPERWTGERRYSSPCTE